VGYNSQNGNSFTICCLPNLCDIAAIRINRLNILMFSKSINCTIWNEGLPITTATKKANRMTLLLSIICRPKYDRFVRELSGQFVPTPTHQKTTLA
ncbi:hypothetical protein BLOT_007473, partial [Blomia tropicalis]